jgi:DNA-binding MarR family transcriptional regulator
MATKVRGAEKAAVKEAYAWSTDELNKIHMDSVGRMLFDISATYDYACIETLRAMGYPLSPAHLNVMPHLDIDGTRLSELAQRAHMTRQSAWELLRTMEAHGYLKRETDPKDSRAHIISYTDKGIDLLRDVCLVIMRLEEDLANRIGKKAVKGLAAALKDIRRSYAMQSPQVSELLALREKRPT